MRQTFSSHQVAQTAPASQHPRYAGLLLCIGLALATTSCGAYIDGDQWADVLITNNTGKQVTLDTHPARDLSPGQKALLGVDSNSNPQTVHVTSPEGRILGCLTFRFHTTSPETLSVSISDVTSCDEKIPQFKGQSEDLPLTIIDVPSALKTSRQTGWAVMSCCGDFGQRN